MPTSEAELLAALEDPSTLAVYADWLEERNDPRAELVRIADTLWREPLDLERARWLTDRRRELLDAKICDVAWHRAISRANPAAIRRRTELLIGTDELLDSTPPSAVIDPAALEAIERRLGRLPEQYRRYVTEIGDGGGGPSGGIRPLGDGADIEESPTVWGGFGRKLTPYHLLVLTGPHAGTVWHDDGVLTPDDIEVLDWYVEWLDEELGSQSVGPHTDAVFERPVEEVTRLDLGSADRVVVPEQLRRFTNVRDLSLRNTAIVELPAWIGELRKLEILDLTSTNLRTLPDEICELSALWWLRLPYCTDLVRLPDTIGRMKVRDLVLSSTSLTALPDSIGDLPLNQIHVDGCRLSTLPPGFGRLVKLSWIDLRGNRITSLPDELAALPALRKVSLADNELVALPPVIGRLPLLDELTLDGNPALDLAGACRILADAPSLYALSIRGVAATMSPDEIRRALPKLLRLVVD